MAAVMSQYKEIRSLMTGATVDFDVENLDEVAVRAQIER